MILTAGIGLAQRLAGTHQRAARAEAGDERVDPAAEGVDDLGARRAVVRVGVRRVGVLERHVDVGVGVGQLARQRDGAVGAELARRPDDLGAVHAQRVGALGRRRLRHHGAQRVAADAADHGQGDAGVAARRLQHHLARLELPVGLGRLDHGARDAILDRAGRVHHLELREQAGAALRRRAGAARPAAWIRSHRSGRRSGCRGRTRLSRLPCRQHDHGRAVRHGGLEALAEADVLVVT